MRDRAFVNSRFLLFFYLVKKPLEVSKFITIRENASSSYFGDFFLEIIVKSRVCSAKNNIMQYLIQWSRNL